MKYLEAWMTIIKGCERKKVELQTYPEIGGYQKWFTVTSGKNELTIEQCTKKTPALKMSRPVKISLKQFEYIFPYYFKKEGIPNKNAEVYRIIIFALIRHFCFHGTDPLQMLGEKEKDGKDGNGKNGSNANNNRMAGRAVTGRYR